MAVHSHDASRVDPHEGRDRLAVVVSAPRSLSLTLVFWWGVCLVIQSAERLFLVATTITREPPTAAILAATLRAGFRADLMGAAGGIVIAVVLGLIIGAGLAIAKRWRKGQAVSGSPWTVGITVGAVVVALLMLAVATADMGYYRYSQRRVDLVFLESVIDVFSPPPSCRTAPGGLGTRPRSRAPWPRPSWHGGWRSRGRSGRCCAAASRRHRGPVRPCWCWRCSPRAPVSTASPGSKSTASRS